MTAASGELGLISVVPNAGASLSNEWDWRSSGLISDDRTDLVELTSTVTPEEMARFLREEHHSLWGRPWSVGHWYHQYLRERGVGLGDRVLDFGCGGGRLGHLLIPDLEAGAYVGIDQHLPALKAFAAYEIPLHGLEQFSPVLMWGGLETLNFLQPGYSVVLDLFASTHLDPDTELPTFLRHVHRLMEPDGRWISLASNSAVAQAAIAAGFRIAHKHVQDIPLFWPLTKKKRINAWVEYVKSSPS